MVDPRRDLHPVPSASARSQDHESDQQLELIRRLNASLAQVSSVEAVAEVVASVAAEALGYDDLVVYLREGENQLVQRAAHGSKGSTCGAVDDPLLLPFGVGIVGAAASAKRTIRVLDTHVDDRYIVDDRSRRSELAVPVVVDDETIAVLDSEHDAVGFYTELDARRLEDIADIAGAQLQAAMSAEALQRSVSELSLARNELEELSNADPLTGLANRRRFETELRRHERGSGSFALLMMDLEGFRSVNQLLGHSAGDEVLRQTGHVLAACARSFSGGCIARLGGDEFCVLLSGVSKDEAVSLGRSIVLAVGSARFSGLEDSPVPIRLRAGVAVGHDLDVWGEASEALRIAKEDRLDVFVHEHDDPRVHRRSADREWAQRIEHAAANDTFRLVAQPIVHSTSPTRSAPMFETLLRLQDSDGELITPDRFLPSAERTGALGCIDSWVVEHALRSLALAGSTATLTVNTTPQSFMSGAVHQTLVRTLEDVPLDPAQIVVELTEHSVVADVDGFRRRSADLVATGARVAIDDLGSGFSSIELLADSGVSIVKIAGDWVSRCVDDPVASTVVRAITRCADLLGVEVVAEGVETEDVLAFVVDAGIGFTQGWLTGRPLPIDVALRGGEVVELPLAA